MPKVFAKKSHAKEAEKKEEKAEAAPEEDPIKVYLHWTAAARPFRKKDHSYFKTLATIVTLLVLIALFAHEPLLAGAILAAAFVAYVLGFVAPEDVEYKISAQGITIGEHFYFWGELNSFWIGEKEGHKVANIFTNVSFPAQLIIPLGSQPEEEVKSILARYLPFHEIPPESFIDHWAKILQKHFPLENPQPKKI